MTEYLAVSNEFDVNETYARSQGQCDTARLAGGGSVSVWRDMQNGSSADQSIQLRLYSPSGEPLTGEITAIASSGSVYLPSVAALPNGGFIVTWEDWNGQHARMFDATGAATTGVLDLAPYSSSIALPTVVGLAGGGFALAWSDQRTTGGDTSGSSMHMRCYDATGALVGAEQQINVATNRNQTDTCMAALTSGGFVVTWRDGGVGGGGSQIKARIYNGSGQALSGEVALSDLSVSATAPSITALADGGFAAHWEENAMEVVQRFSSQGVAVGPKLTTAMQLYGAGCVSAKTDIVALSGGGLAIAWVANYDIFNDGSGTSIAVQVFDSSGNTAGPMRANIDSEGDQIQPVLTALDNGAFMVSWTDMATGGDTIQVSSRIFAPTIAFAGDPAHLSIAEGATQIATIVANSTRAGATITYAIAGGADAGLFAIDATTGQLSFTQAQDYEAPRDQGGDRIYDVVLRAFDATSTADCAVRIALTNVNEPVVITSFGGADAADIKSTGGTSAFVSLAASDPDGGAVSWAIVGGDDAAFFALDPGTGALAFKQAPNASAPVDADANGVYAVTVSASDGVFADTQMLRVSVVQDHAPIITSFSAADAASLTIAENGQVVTTLTATDPDGDTLAWSIAGGADAAFFTVDAKSGALRLVSAPDYEKRADANLDGTYEVTVRASDGQMSDTQALLVTVANVNEAPVITSGGGTAACGVSVAENLATVATMTAADPEGGVVTWSIAGGADAARFVLDAKTGALGFVSAPNYEAPSDANRDNVYDVIVAASDGALSGTQTVSVKVTNVNEAPVITSGGAGDAATYSIAENTTAVASLTASDPEGAAISWTIAGGADASRFTISAGGTLSFATAPDYEAPTDVNRDNIYELAVAASDGVMVDVQALKVTVTDVNENPTLRYGTSSTDYMYGTDAPDSFSALGGADYLFGYGGADTLNGGAGSDYLCGGVGADVLTGGTEMDAFVYSSIADSAVGAEDTITDFSHAQWDYINLYAIDANTLAAGDQAFTYIGSAAFTGVAGQLRAAVSGSSMMVTGDVNGDRVADFGIRLTGVTSLVASDFSL
ncbi:ribosomal protein S11 [Rhodoblastus acidophilus]|uniref:cadherin domain-containing protein n=1 Tax=Rhodoblastus acidophilus TaxID=1074 RepID=UPI00222557D2|nr:cadherin domain-containing protein [Rhodoblastus acidophilus]MCW2283671.1 ribosomal protein S11 [Rhodoblastus acidophilus]MCW2332531.1 ribosomal protein S11 [Rhodoblastus acidophilus]